VSPRLLPVASVPRKTGANAVAEPTSWFRIPNIHGVGMDRMDLSAIMPAAVGVRVVGNFVPMKITVARLSVGLVFILHAISVATGHKEGVIGSLYLDSIVVPT
jgi:hypothetical protein